MANRARRAKQAQFSDLYRLLNEENLRGCFYQLRRSTAPGADKVSRRLRSRKRLLTLPGNVVQMDFLESHPLIRSLDAYRIELNTNQNTTPAS